MKEKEKKKLKGLMAVQKAVQKGEMPVQKYSHQEEKERASGDKGKGLGAT